MTKEILTRLIDNRLYLDLFLISVSCIVDSFILIKFGFLILKVKVGFKDILPITLAMALFNFFMHQYLPFPVFFASEIALTTIFLVTAGKVKILQGIWTSLLLVVGCNLGPIIISPLFFINRGIMNFLINTPTGYTLGPLIEAFVPLLGIILLIKKPNISLIPPIISKRVDVYDVLGLITYGAMANLLFFTSVQLYTSFKSISPDTLLNITLYFSSAVVIVCGHISIVHALKKRFESQLFKLEEEKAELEEREAKFQQKITDFEQMEADFQKEKAELVTEITGLRSELQELLTVQPGEEVPPLHKIQDTVYDIKVKLDDLDRVCKSIAKQQKPPSLPDTGEKPPSVLDSRERKILKGIGKGLIYKEIAAQVDVTEGTLRHIVGDIMKKLGLKNKSDLAAYAARHGLDQE